MTDPRDIVEIGGVRVNAHANGDLDSKMNCESRRKRFLSVWYRCCNVYGRLYRNHAQTAYEGRCPRCGASVSARIGAGGTSRRMFEAG